jgi:hypothetical protein
VGKLAANLELEFDNSHQEKNYRRKITQNRYGTLHCYYKINKVFYIGNICFVSFCLMMALYKQHNKINNMTNAVTVFFLYRVLYS